MPPRAPWPRSAGCRGSWTARTPTTSTTTAPASLAATTGAAAGAKTAAKAGIAENFQAFMTLLTTQLKNQNPLEPLDANQFTQQLVQFASVEQQLRTNDTLGALLTSASVTVPWLPVLVGIALTLLAWLLLSRLTDPSQGQGG